MKPGNIFLLAILVGALASALIVRHVRRLEAEIDAIRGSSTRPTVDVVVANDTIPIGSRVEAAQLKLVAWPVQAQPEGTVNDTKLVVGSIVRRPVEVPTVAVLVNPEDAERLTLATRYEPVRLALRNYRDEEVVRTTGIVTKALFQGDGHPVAVVQGKPQKVKAPAPYSVEILLG